MDASTGKVTGAKNPHKVGNFFDFRAAYVEPSKRGSQRPAVRMTRPDGTVVTSEQQGIAQVLSRVLGREVAFVHARDDEESGDYRDTVTDFDLPAGTFFDAAVVHVLTTACMST